MSEYERGKADGAREIRERVEAVMADFMEDEYGAHVVYVWRLRTALAGITDSAAP